MAAAAALLFGLPHPAAARVSIEPSVVETGGLAIVRSDAPVTRGVAGGKPLRFFTIPGGGAAALIGVDLDAKAATLPVEVELRSGARERARLEIRAKTFPEERLTVPKTYVEPDPQTLRRIEREQKRLAALWPNVLTAPLWSGAFALPCDGPAGSPFGLRRFFNGEPRSPHAGIDFKAPQGAPVHASNRGRVVLADELFFTGNTVVVDHGLGLFTMYIHLSKMEVRAGDSVDKGTEIGQVGMTGRATGPHLHFAVRVGDARIDPAALLGRDLEAAGKK